MPEEKAAIEILPLSADDIKRSFLKETELTLDGFCCLYKCPCGKNIIYGETNGRPDRVKKCFYCNEEMK